mmetsp:Transcript_19729/g.29104  ORF Transcript_19729/g.29104 Transcript_19729/m.29104 type:complete len:97 (-) Transcript_19729:1722-2012(-)
MVAPDGSAIKSAALNIATFSVFALTAAWFHYEQFYYLKLLFIVLIAAYLVPPAGMMRQCATPTTRPGHKPTWKEPQNGSSSLTSPKKRTKKARKED